MPYSSSTFSFSPTQIPLSCVVSQFLVDDFLVPLAATGCALASLRRPSIAGPIAQKYEYLSNNF